MNKAYGYNKWKNQFERHVKRGEHGITIIAPTPFKKKIEEQKLDPDTKAPILDAEGKAVMEEREVEIPMFRPVKVFDVSQTDGKPLPELASSLSGTVPHYEAFLEAVRRSAPVRERPELRGFHGGPAPVRAGAALRGADGRQHGRVFLAGPAAHRHPGRHERGADRFRRRP